MSIFNKTLDKLNIKKDSTKYNVIIFTFLFIILSLVIYSPFIIFGKSFLWIKGAGDGISQHCPALMYIGIWGREFIRNIFNGNFTIPVWDFSIGYGADAITTLHYYGLGDPLSLFSIIVPAKYTEYLYEFLIILRLYIAGLGFNFYCKKMNQNFKFTILGSFMYIFCGFAIFSSVRHPFFLTPMVYFPLVLIGCEKILQKENPLLFIISVALCVLSNFYFAYMIILFTIIYVVIRFVYTPHKNFLKEMFALIGKFLGFGVVSLLISAVLFLPIFIVFLSNTRADVSNAIPLLYDISYYESLFSSFMGYNQVGHWNVSGYGPISLIAVFYIFIKKGSYKPLKTAFIALLIIQTFPIFGYILNGFTYVNNRYIWVNAFALSFIAVYTMKDIINSTREEKIKLFAISCIYTIVFFIMRKGENEAILSQYILLFAVLVIIIAGNVIFSKNVLRKSYIAFSIICAISITINGIYCYSPIYNDYLSEFENIKGGLKTIRKSPSYAFDDEIQYTDSSFQRYEASSIEARNSNNSLLNNTAGLSYYFSFNNDKVSSFIYEMEVPAITQYFYKNLNNRTSLTTLASTKYSITKNKKFVPYNYKYVGKNNGYYLYENQSCLPLGYTYSKYITRDKYQELSSIEKQEAIMQNVLLESEIDGFKNGRYNLTSEEIPYEITCDENIIQTEDGFYVKKNNAVMKFEFNGIKNSETYICISNLNGQHLDEYELSQSLPSKYENISKLTRVLNKYNDIYKNTKTELRINVKSSDTSPLLQFRTPEDPFYGGIHNFTANLGYSEDAINGCSFTFATKGFYSWDDIKVICQPMENQISYTRKLSQDVLENIKLEDNKVSGTISLEQDKILCLSIPYSNGWTCYVNGKETEILRANTWAMALPLTAGTYDIRLEYATPGLKTGAILTTLGIILTIGICTHYVINKKKRNQVL